MKIYGVIKLHNECLYFKNFSTVKSMLHWAPSKYSTCFEHIPSFSALSEGVLEVFKWVIFMRYDKQYIKGCCPVPINRKADPKNTIMYLHPYIVIIVSIIIVSILNESGTMRLLALQSQNGKYIFKIHTGHQGSHNGTTKDICKKAILKLLQTWQEWWDRSTLNGEECFEGD